METNNPKSRDIKELKVRKIALKQEMEQIQADIESSLKDVRHSVVDRTRIRFWVEKYPLQLLGSALIVGFILARKGGGKTTGTDNTTIKAEAPATAESSRSSFTSLLMDELKKMASQRAVRFLMQRLEEALDERKSKEG